MSGDQPRVMSGDQPRVMSGDQPRALIAVDGIDGSGKSVLAAQLSHGFAAAGIGAVSLGVDDFRRPVDWRPAGRSEGDVYYDDYYDLAALDQCLRAFLVGTPSVRIPVFDSGSERLTGTRIIDCAGATVAIVEGVFALRLPTVSAEAAVIYLRTGYAEARRRIVARDTARGRALGDVNHRIDARYVPGQEKYLRDFDPLTRADVVIDNEQLAAPCLLRFRPDRLAPALAAALAAALAGFATPGPVE